MSADTILVIDAGTTSLRAVAVTSAGLVNPLAVEPWPLFVPEDAAPFGREFDITELQAAVRRLLAAAMAAGTPAAAIAVTGQREGVVFTDAEDNIVFAAPNIDARASAEGMAIDARRGDEVYRVTGHLPALILAPAKLAWLRANRAAAAARVAHVLPLADWLAFFLTGEQAMTRTLAAENGLLDVSSGAVPAGLLDACGLAAEMLCPPVPEGTIVGHASCVAPGNIPAVLAGADTQAALVGMGAVSPGDVGVPAGWSAPLQMVTERPVFDSAQRTWTSVHAVAGRWILESNAGETGRCWQWLLSMLALEPTESETLAEASPPGARDVLAVFGAAAMDAARLNAGLGALTFPLPLVMLAPERGDLLRSALESIAFALRANLEQLEAVYGSAATSFSLGGGMSRSPLFARIVADVLDRPVAVARDPQTSALGAAALAAVAIGQHGTLEDAVTGMELRGLPLEPEPPAAATYEDAYRRWRALAEEMPRLAELG